MQSRKWIVRSSHLCLEIRLQAPSELKYRMRQIHVISSQVASEPFLCFKVWQIPVSRNNKKNVCLSCSPNPACANTATRCANPQDQYNHPQLLFYKFVQPSRGISGLRHTAAPRAAPHGGAGTAALTPTAPTASAAALPALRAKTLHMYKQFVPLITTVSSK